MIGRLGRGLVPEPRLVAAFGWVVLAAVLGRGGLTLSNLVVARALNPGEFGNYALAQSTSITAGILLGTGVGIAVAKLVVSDLQTNPRLVQRVLWVANVGLLTISLGCAALIFGSADWLSATVFNQPSVASTLRAAAWLVPASALGTLHANVLIAAGVGRRFAFLSAAGGVSTLVAVAISAASHNLLTITHALVLGQTVAAGLTLFATVRLVPTPLKSEPYRAEAGIFGAMALFALPITLASVCTAGADWLGPVILARTPDGLRSVGAFSVGIQWFTAFSFLPVMLSRVTQPEAFAHAAAADSASARLMLRKATWLVMAIVTPPLLVALVLAPNLMAIGGEALRPQWPVLAVMLASVWLVAACKAPEQLILAEGRGWATLASYLMYGMAYIGGSVFFALPYGALGVALARAGGFAANLAALTRAARPRVSD
jgi:O-antigen/teichoic acid export membrane protein